MKKQPFRHVHLRSTAKQKQKTMEIPLSSWVLMPVDVTKTKLSFDLQFQVCLPFTFTYM